MATFRIDQSSPGAGTPGVSRHDLVSGEVITLVATAPLGGGVTYAWEILDKVGSTAILSATTGTSVTIGPDEDITELCSFLIKLTTNENGTITSATRIASVRSAALGLRAPLFPETSSRLNRLGSYDPDLSTDNAIYADLGGLGASGQNWRGWAEWGWEIVNALESVAGDLVGSAGGDLSGSYPNPEVAAIRGNAVSGTTPDAGNVLRWDGASWVPSDDERFFAGAINETIDGDDPEIVLGGFVFDGGAHVTGTITWRILGTLQVSGSGSGEIRLYDLGPVAGPPITPVERASATIANGDAGSVIAVEVEVAVSDSITGPDMILDSPRMYEVRAEIDSGDLGDTLQISSAGLWVSSG